MGLRWSAVLGGLLLLATAGKVLPAMMSGLVYAVPPTGRFLPGGTLVLDVSARDPDLSATEWVGCLEAWLEPDSGASLEWDGRSSSDGTCVDNGFAGEKIRLDAAAAAGTLVLRWNATPVRFDYLVPRGETWSGWVEMDRGGPEGDDVQAQVGFGDSPLSSWSSRGIARLWVVLGGLQALAFLAIPMLLLARAWSGWAWTSLFVAVALLLFTENVQSVRGWPLWAALLLLMSVRVSAAVAKTEAGPPPEAPAKPPGDEPPPSPLPSLDAIGLREDWR